MTRRWELLLFLAAIGFAVGEPACGAPPAAEAEPRSIPPRQLVRTDSYGDRLPEGAVARLGTVRLRQRHDVFSVIFTPDGKGLIAADSGWRGGTKDHLIGIYDPRTGALVRSFAGHRYGGEKLALSPDGKTLAGIGGASSVFVWDLATGRRLHELGLSDEGNLIDLVFFPDGKTLATIGCGSRIQLWDVTTGKRRRVLAGEEFGWCVARSPDGKLLATGGAEALQLWDTAAGNLIWQIKAGKGGIHAVAFSPDGKMLAAGDGGGGVLVVAPTDAKKFRHWAAHAVFDANHFGTQSLTFSPDGKVLASGGDDGVIHLWDPLTGAAVRALRGHQGAVYSVAFSPDSRALASCSLDHSVRLWDVSAGRERPAFGGHQSLVSCVAFSPDGKILSSGGFDSTVRLWDPERGKQLQLLKDHSDSVTALTYSADGKLLAFADWSNVVRLCDPATCTIIRSFGGRGRASAYFRGSG